MFNLEHNFIGMRQVKNCPIISQGKHPGFISVMQLQSVKPSVWFEQMILNIAVIAVNYLSVITRFPLIRTNLNESFIRPNNIQKMISINDPTEGAETQ